MAVVRVLLVWLSQKGSNMVASHCITAILDPRRPKLFEVYLTFGNQRSDLENIILDPKLKVYTLTPKDPSK